MTRVVPRTTVKADVTITGRGLHSGAPCRVTIRPSGHGIHFIAGGEAIEATVENVSDTSRCTRLGAVSTVEHCLSALWGLGVTDAAVEVEGGELPGLDGSAAPYVEALLANGFYGVGELHIDGPFARVYHIDGPVKIAIAAGEGHWRYTYDLGERWPGEQSYELALSPSSYAQEIASARTIVLEEEIDLARAAGLGQGLEEGGVVAIGKQGYLTEVRFPNEPARHKLLDLIGDLALSGVPCAALNVTADRSGHRTNVAAAAKLARHVRIRRVP